MTLTLLFSKKILKKPSLNGNDIEFHNSQLFTVKSFLSRQERPQLSCGFLRCRKTGVPLFLFFCTPFLI